MEEKINEMKALFEKFEDGKFQIRELQRLQYQRIMEMIDFALRSGWVDCLSLNLPRFGMKLHS